MLLLLTVSLLSCSFAVDPERDLHIKNRITQYGYPFETHTITTNDGYIIDFHRIPTGRDVRTITACKNRRPPMVLMHGLFSTSEQFVVNPPTSGHAFILADAGFDVWLCNVRGNRFGLNHTDLSSDDSRFWSFTWYEHAHLDLKKQIEYILDKTGFSSVFYIGHSQGTTIMLALLAESEPSFQKKIRRFHAMAPVAGSVAPFAPFTALFNENVQDMLEVISFTIPSFRVALPKTLNNLLGSVCSLPIIGDLCLSVVAISAEGLDQLNTSRFDVYTAIFPDATSFENILHWSQVFAYHSIRKMDHGKRKNVKLYGTENAPLLNISNILTPTELWYSEDDHLTDESDVRQVIIDHIGPGLKALHEVEGYTHFDFAIGLRAPDDIFHPMIELLKQEIDEYGCDREADFSE